MTEEQKAEKLDKWLELQKRWLHEKISLGKVYDVIEKAFYEGIDIGFKDCAKARLNVTTISDCPIKDEWHDLEKDPADVPDDKRLVWCQYFDEYEVGWYDADTKYWTLIYHRYHTECVKAWCELPKRKEIL